MNNVSLLATIFGVIGCIPFFILGIGWLLVASSIPATAPFAVAVGGVVACFALSSSAFLYWGILRALCEIHKALPGGGA